MTLAELLAEQIEGTREWTNKLLADVKGEDWFFQPGPGLGHPLWMCGHLAGSQGLLVFVRCLGQKNPVPEEFTKHFPIGGPVKSAREYDYPPLQTVLDMMRDIHAKTCATIRGLSDALLAEPAYGAEGKPHPHYKDKRGCIAHCNRHEAFHAGQLAMIRRLLGKPFLR